MADYSLYIIPTPIGNRADITQRALTMLQQVDWVAAEDTRNTGLLLQAYGIKAKYIPLHEHNEVGKAEAICNLLAKGESVALVSDAGTPLISDPGSKLVQIVVAKGFQVVPLPGACAVTCALSAAGLDCSSFLFAGFLPNKPAARLKKLNTFKAESHTLIFYEAARRLVDCVQAMREVFGGERQIVLARELTKVHEEFVRGDIDTILQKLEDGKIVLKGECVLLVAGAETDCDNSADEIIAILQVVMPHTSLKSAVKIVVELSGAKRSLVYDLALQLGKE